LSWYRPLGDGLGLHVGAAALIAPMVSAGGVVADLRVVAGLEVLP
jgi:hypothetical protein